jgi:AcrR family transcriptional regulator
MGTATRARRGRPPRPEQVARNRRLLLDAAWAVFGELGYSGATVDAIAERAGFSKGAVYSQFQGKADLFLSLLEDQIEHRVAIGQTALDNADPRRTFTEIFEQSRAEPAWRLALLEFRVVAARDPELNARYAAAHRTTIAAVAEALRQIHERLGATPRRPLEQLAAASLALDAGAFLEAVAEAGVLPPERAADLFMDMLGLPDAADAQAAKEPS